MCRGIGEGEETNRRLCLRRSVLISCELCGTRASLYCEADKAFLCRKCDRWVHQANFLVRRHVRCVLCAACQKLTRRFVVGGSVDVVLSAAPTVNPPLEVRRRDGDDNLADVEIQISRRPKVPYMLL